MDGAPCIERNRSQGVILTCFYFQESSLYGFTAQRRFVLYQSKVTYPSLKAAVSGIEWKLYLLELIVNSDDDLFCIFFMNIL